MTCSSSARKLESFYFYSLSNSISIKALWGKYIIYWLIDYNNDLLHVSGGWLRFLSESIWLLWNGDDSNFTTEPSYPVSTIHSDTKPKQSGTRWFTGMEKLTRKQNYLNISYKEKGDFFQRVVDKFSEIIDWWILQQLRDNQAHCQL